MANGKGSRWKAGSDMPKHLAAVHGESLLERIVRQLIELKVSDIVITSSNLAYNVFGAHRHEPASDKFELDRFTTELIADDCCFLYGDTFYTDEAMRTIVKLPVSELMFVGSARSIVAVIVKKREPFEKALFEVRAAIERGEIEDARGWEVHNVYTGQPLDSRKASSEDYLIIGGTKNINTVEDYYELVRSPDWNA